MNIQDIADFIDLVKNPSKYEAVIQNLKDEQARLTAVVETVGKVSEINKLLKNAQVKEENLVSQYEDRFKALERQSDADTLALSKLKAKAIQDQQNASKALAESAQQQADNELVKKQLDIREKELLSKEHVVKETQDKLDSLVAQYEEKVAKLRSVMV